LFIQLRARDSIWKGDYAGILKSKLQEFSQHASYKKLLKAVDELVDIDKDIPLDTMLQQTAPYVHKDYDGDPVMAIGTASALANKGVSGICNVLPFICRVLSSVPFPICSERPP
jgi:hypothetical protein